jgi:hypothetical protein
MIHYNHQSLYFKFHPVHEQDYPWFESYHLFENTYREFTTAFVYFL